MYTIFFRSSIFYLFAYRNNEQLVKIITYPTAAKHYLFTFYVTIVTYN